MTTEQNRKVELHLVESSSHLVHWSSVFEVFTPVLGLKPFFRRPSSTERFHPLPSADDGMTQKRIRPHRLWSG